MIRYSEKASLSNILECFRKQKLTIILTCKHCSLLKPIADKSSKMSLFYYQFKNSKILNSLNLCLFLIQLQQVPLTKP